MTEPETEQRGSYRPRPALLNELARRVHVENLRWWRDPTTGLPVDRNVPEQLALMHSEISEALEAFRKNLNDDHLPHRQGFEVELADLIIRVLDTAGAYALDLDGAFWEKLAYNAQRHDHTDAARIGAHGKKF